jgi:hypothetical protein
MISKWDSCRLTQKIELTKDGKAKASPIICQYPIAGTITLTEGRAKQILDVIFKSNTRKFKRD